MTKKIDLTGRIFDEFQVISEEIIESSSYKRYWKCLCNCGKTFTRQQSNILHRKSGGCGCNKKRSHGLSNTPTYKSWEMMIQRCTNPKYDRYPYYGGRGITLDSRWLLFENFLDDMGLRPDGKTLDRIDVNKGYSKENCRWADQTTQVFNRRPLRDGKRTGVYYHKATGKWTAQISFQGKNYHLGLYPEIEDAIIARENAEVEFYGKVEGLAEADDMETMN